MNPSDAPSCSPGGLSDRHIGNTQRLDVLMEKYTQQLDDAGDQPAEGTTQPTTRRSSQSRPSSEGPSSLVEASSQLSRWLEGYFTDPLCGLKGVVIVTLFESLDAVCGEDEPWDGVGDVSDIYVVHGVIAGGVMDDLGWEVGENLVEEGEADLSTLDEDLCALYPGVYGPHTGSIGIETNVGGDAIGFPSVSVGPGADGDRNRDAGVEEETCEQVGIGRQPGDKEQGGRMKISQEELTGLLEVIEDVPGRAGVLRENEEHGVQDEGAGVAPTPVGEATEAAVGELLRLGDVFPTGGSVGDRELREAAEDVSRRLRKGGEPGHETGHNSQKERDDDESEIVPNSQEEEEEALPPVPLVTANDARDGQHGENGHPIRRESQPHHTADGFALPAARNPKESYHAEKGGTPSSAKEYNPASDPYLLSGLHATADCLLMVQPTAKEDNATEPWMSIPKLHVGDANAVICGSTKGNAVAKQGQKRAAQGRQAVPAEKKARAANRRRTRRCVRDGKALEDDEDDENNDDMEVGEDHVDEDSDIACPVEASGEEDEADDAEVQVRTRPHRMIATCPSESQASAKEYPILEMEGKTRRDSNAIKRKSTRAATHAPNVAEGKQATEHAQVRRPRRHSARHIENANDNTEDMPIGEYVKEQKKVGCSKCRYKGCKECRGYTLKEAREKGMLRGIAFMISRDGSKVGTKAQEELSKTIKSLGGRVLNSLSDLLKITPGVAKSSPKNKAKTVEQVLVTNSSTNRTLKCIAARVVGMPMISPDWVAECMERRRLGGFTARTANVLIGKGSIKPSGPLLSQLRVYLIIERPSANAQDINALIKLLGGIPVRGPFRNTTDLVLYDGATSSAQMRKEIDRVTREARKLRKPAYPLSWLTDAIAKDETDGIVEELERAIGHVDGNASPAANMATRGKGKEKDASMNTKTTRANRKNAERPVVQETEVGQSEDDLMAIIDQQKEASEHRRREEQRQKEQSRRINRQSDHRPLHRALEEAAPNTFRETDDPFCQPLDHPFHGISSMMNFECTWEPIDESLSGSSPPQGMRPTTIRKYFSSMLSSNKETVRVGDFVELVPGPGFNQPRIAQVLALWKQLGRPKENCLFGRFLRYYRFAETSLNRIGLKSADNEKRVYKTTHIEDNVPLAAILNTCSVEVMSGVDAPTEFQTQQMSDKEALLCSATYDFETGALAPIE